uniref:Uncharacterized protein n=1 Tax=Oryza glumipatula TaxID=40148 RepID=A0A0E0AF90_9ORYZ
MPINAVIIPHIPTSVMRARVSRRHLAHPSPSNASSIRFVSAAITQSTCSSGSGPLDQVYGSLKPGRCNAVGSGSGKCSLGTAAPPCNCISSTILLAAAPPLPYPRRTKNAIKLISMDKKPAKNLTGFLATTAGAVKALSEHKKNALTKVKSSGNTREHSMVLRDEWEDEIATLLLQFEQKDIEEENEGKNNLKPQRGGANKEQIHAGDGRN